MTRPFRPILPSLDIYLVTSQEDVDNIKELEGYTLPYLDGATAKCCHISHTTSGVNVIVIYYPTLLEDEPIHSTCTLVHECCHAWDFIKNHFGFTDDTELHAYSVESIFLGAYNKYAKLNKRKMKGGLNA